MAPADAAHLARGAQAEALAAQFLERRGLTIVTRNFRIRQGEIDLVARDGDTLVFVEVRLRGRRDFGGAAASVTARKQQRIVTAALAYLARLPHEPACRFDAILLDRLDPAAIVWERDVIARD
ncbi:MAG: YraN family protein [Burkholderiales bacterium]|nr:YraN family protein [Burkholderiales bacterium]